MLDAINEANAEVSALLAGAAAMLPFVVLLTHFPQAYAARACEKQAAHGLPAHGSITGS